jgi:hypothetical protein
MKTLKFSKLAFFLSFLLCALPVVLFLLAFLINICTYGARINDLVFLVILFPFSFFLFFVINYYLYDKDTIIKIDGNGNVNYSNKKQIHFHLQDIDSCTELLAKLPLGFTEINLKSGYCLYVSNFISLDPIYKMNPNIKKEYFGIFWLKILRREKLTSN